jgi:hypothetical protein
MGGPARGASGLASGGTASEVERFYGRLGIEITAGKTGWASCRCFLPGHKDAHASMSVNLSSGAWRCHGCSTTGSAYSAARALGWSEPDAHELAKSHGLWIAGPPRFGSRR